MKERDEKVTHCPSGENHQVSEDILVLLFSNHGSPRLYVYLSLSGRNGGRGRFKKKISRMCLRPKKVDEQTTSDSNESQLFSVVPFSRNSKSVVDDETDYY